MLDKYIEEVKNYINKMPNKSEEAVIKHVYLDLGNRFSFDTNYMPFGDSKKRQSIYRESNFFASLDKCMLTNTIICNSAANILTYVGKKLGINIETIIDPLDTRKTPHAYNLITPKDNKEKYTIDLQEDLYHIKMHGFTRNFGLSYKNPNNYVISRFEQENIDRLLGYIDNENYYTDDYFYTLKFDIGFFDTLKDKVQFVLENIEVYENSNISYIDRQWYHVRVLEKFFNLSEFDYQNSRGKIRFIDCYKMINNEKKYLSVVVVDEDNNPDIYIYNERKMKYSKIDFIYFAYAIKNGVIILHNKKIRNLGKTIKKIDEAKMSYKKLVK